MATFWSLVNVSKGQQFTLMLCVLSLIVQWSCHCSGEGMEANKIANTSDVNSTTANTTQYSNVTTSTESIPLGSTSMFRILTDITVSAVERQMDLHDSPSQSGEKSQIQGTEPESDYPVVFISLLVLGLLCALGILATSYYLCKKSRTPPRRKLDEEADARDHDSIYFSAASEGQSDKPKQNGEAQEKGESSKDAASAEPGEKQAKKGKEEGDTEL
ncbi:uncharacterized protein LOC134355878 [Mobula hypostoma]|uniref:uncharacterized protein LOC134355878 n=1 Tax=Mobula hypostoma TaxID=723540 RepID=UPI002FC294B4